jgi:menaquinone-dependent protoporphyrinogen oxidase
MRTLIAFGSTQGQTRKIVDFIAARWRDAGHDVAVIDAARAGRTTDPLLYDAVLLAASLHLGRYQPAVVRFARVNAAALSNIPSSFVSVSLSAAGKDADDLAGLDRADQALFARTGWHPTQVHHAAGALAYTRYNFLLRPIMKRIARARGASTDTSRDCEFTDYAALGRFVDAFLIAAMQSAPACRATNGREHGAV